jgi:hypothetical protein
MVPRVVKDISLNFTETEVLMPFYQEPVNYAQRKTHENV